MHISVGAVSHHILFLEAIQQLLLVPSFKSSHPHLKGDWCSMSL
jgi:hypothetical protein